VTPSELLDAMPSVASQLMLALKHGVIMQETLVTVRIGSPLSVYKQIAS